MWLDFLDVELSHQPTDPSPGTAGSFSVHATSTTPVSPALDVRYLQIRQAVRYARGSMPAQTHG